MEGKLYQRRFLMMKVVLFSCLMVFFFSCACNRKIEQKDSISKAYLITDIKAKNSWYLIYAKRLDTCYKIVVKKHYLSIRRKIVFGHIMMSKVI
jgi:quinol-cytochrome oxidoreductase complex cytochrome b subunit